MKKLIYFLITIISLQLVNAQNTIWKPINTGITDGKFYNIVFASENVGMIVGNNGTTNYILKTIDGGNTWTNVATATITNMAIAIDFLDENNWYLVCENGGMFISKDGGTTWTKNHLGNNLDLYDISMVSNKFGIICTEGGRYVKFDGAGWLTNNVFNGDKFIKTEFFDKDNGVILAEKGRFWRTKDGATTWDSIHNFMGTCNNMHFLHQAVGHIVGTKGLIARSVSGGTNWSKYVALGYENTNFMAVHFPSSSSGYVAGEKGIILKTENGCLNWTTENADTTEDILAMTSTPEEGNAFAVGTNGLVLKRTRPSSIKNENDMTIVSVYPNIIQQGESVHIILDKPIQTNITIYDINGKSIKSFETNTAQMDFNTNEFARGIYLLKIQGNGVYNTQRLIVK